MRNKIIVLTAFLMLAASSAFADSTISMGTFTQTGLQLWGAKTAGAAANLGIGGSTAGLIGKTSTNVGIGVNTASTGYCVLTQHKMGSQEFGTASNTVTTYHIPVVTTGTPQLTVPSKPDSTDLITTGWTSM